MFLENGGIGLIFRGDSMGGYGPFLRPRRKIRVGGEEYRPDVPNLELGQNFSRVPRNTHRTQVESAAGKRPHGGIYENGNRPTKRNERDQPNIMALFSQFGAYENWGGGGRAV